jgi:ATP-dependent DNA ligase
MHGRLRRNPQVSEAGAKLGVEGMVSKQIDKPYLPGNRGVWVKTKFLNRQEFVIVGWTDPEGSRSSLGSLQLGYYRDDGKLIYAGRAGTGMAVSELTALLNKLRPLASDKMTVDVPPPKTTRFGTPLVLSRVHWVRPELVAEVTYLTWTADGLLRHVVYEGLREDKSPRDRAGALLPDRAGSSAAIGQVRRGSSTHPSWSCPPWSSYC